MKLNSILYLIYLVWLDNQTQLNSEIHFSQKYIQTQHCLLLLILTEGECKQLIIPLSVGSIYSQKNCKISKDFAVDLKFVKAFLEFTDSLSNITKWVANRTKKIKAYKNRVF